MSENTDEPNDPLDTVSSSPIGSPQSRAAARAACGPGGAPIFVSEYTKAGARDETGCPIGPVVVCKSKTATVNGKLFTRADGESEEQFRERCFAACFVFRQNTVRFHGDAYEDYVHAEWLDQKFLREPDESLEKFRNRVHASLPPDGHRGLILWHEK